MAAEMASLLDELMGRDRNSAPGEAQEYHFTDPDVCKHYLCGLCPHDLFTNTKSHLGICQNRHDDAMVAQWEAEEHKEKFPYQRDLTSYARMLVEKLDKIKERTAEKLRFQQQRAAAMPTPDTPDQLRLAEITAENAVLLKRIEALGEQGLIDEAEVLNTKMEQLNAEKAQLTQKIELSKDKGGAADRSLTVCEVCGTFLSETDVGDRLVNHTEGKQHRGYALLRAQIKAYDELPDEKKYQPEASSTHKSRERDPLEHRRCSI
eukprot:TRINITY_DN3408_c0_g1_i3.p1 TRINITY_DN3408_c0_g1~~TRINITY_DN3408_c0_g1_i3.p1  ORF type:complete len:286 (-),score=52.31 TRINITY_DN3408_c0_g1_i3:118-906(-)